MKNLGLVRDALTASVAAALLVGCGGDAASVIARSAADGAGRTRPYHHTFKYTGAEQSFEVPSSVKLITVVARGAAGGGPQGGLGGRVFAQIPVTPYETLYVDVGGAGKSHNGGFNGGGRGGGGGGYYGGGGGGEGGANGSSPTGGGGGGGGGSSYIEPSAKRFHGWRGWKRAVGDGLVVFSW